MSHLPNEVDIKTDLRRSVMASFSPRKFADANVVTFVNNAQKNLEILKERVGKRKYTAVKARIAKSRDTEKPIEKRREDLLMASTLV